MTVANKFPHALELATRHLAIGHPHVAHGRHGVRLRVPLEGTSVIQVRLARSARAAPAVQACLKAMHGIPLTEAAAERRWAGMSKRSPPNWQWPMPSGQFESMGEFIGDWLVLGGVIGSMC